MPPANSPNDSPPPISEESSPYLQQLEAISSPVPDFAATLMAPEEQEVNDANTRFLRTRIPETSAEANAAQEVSEQDPVPGWYRRAIDRREATLRSPSMESRQPGGGSQDHTEEPNLIRHGPRLRFGRQQGDVNRQIRNPDSDEDANYTNRTPQRQSLYDWAPYEPMNDDDNRRGDWTGRQEGNDDDLPSYASYARYRWLERRQQYEQARHETASPRATHQPRDEPSGRTTLSTLSEALRRETQARRESLASTTSLLRSVERHRRNQDLSPEELQARHRQSRARRWHNAVPDADEGRTTSTRLHRSEQLGTASRTSDWHNSVIPSTRHAMRQKFLEDPSLMRVREVMHYLSELRHCDSAKESLSLAKSHYLCEPKSETFDQPMLERLDFVGMNESSWLVPGAAFCGTQSASFSVDDGPVFVHQPPQHNSRSRIPAHDGAADPTGISVTTASGRRYEADNILELYAQDRRTLLAARGWGNEPSADRSHSADLDEPNSWPVSVTIDTLSLSTMTVTGTMSASKIRDKRSPTGESSSTTYFDGEIIDLRTHTFETEHFESEGLETDVMYWTRIGPFRGMDESEVAQCLLDKGWIENKLLGEWVLMRWKERSFVPPTPSPNPGGISIRGFYYVALNRQSGVVDGSYGNHPESQPYQKLRMAPANGRGDDMEQGLPCFEGGMVGGVRRWWPAQTLQ